MEYVKIVVTVPEGEADALRQTIGNAGGGVIGNYSHCSFSVKGVGRSLPHDGANPAIGVVGLATEIMEERIEITCEKEKWQELVALIRTAHSYDEPAIDIYPLLNGI